MISNLPFLLQQYLSLPRPLLCQHHGILTSLPCSSCFQPWFSLFSSFSIPSSITFLSSPQPLLSFHHSIMCQINSVSNLRCFIIHGMVDCTSHIWSDRNLTHSFFVAWLTVPAIYEVTVILAIHSSWHSWLYQPYMEWP